MVVGRAREDIVVDVLDVPLEDIAMGKVEVAEAQALHGNHYRFKLDGAVSSATVALSAVQLGHVGVRPTRAGTADRANVRLAQADIDREPRRVHF